MRRGVSAFAFAMASAWSRTIGDSAANPASHVRVACDMLPYELDSILQGLQGCYVARPESPRWNRLGSKRSSTPFVT